jgi:hypothetical protein
MEYRRQVAMRCDGEDFVIALQPEDEVVFRTKDARALRNLCRRLDRRLDLAAGRRRWRTSSCQALVNAPLFWHR